MNLKQATSPSSALPARPERPFKFVLPVSAPDGTVGYDRPLENYFDPSLAPRLLPPVPPHRLYDTVARSHDHRYQVTHVSVDPSWATPRPLILNPRERPRSLAKLSGNSPEYMGISPHLPEWRPRRSSYEDRRGAVGVTPSEVNTLVPYIPPIDTSLPPPSKERLDEMAKRFLADAQADFDDPHRKLTIDATSIGPSFRSGNSIFFDYDSDNTLDGAVAASRPFVSRPSLQAPRAVSEIDSHDADFNSSTDTDTDSDTDMDTDGGYDWNATPIPRSGPGSQWLIPRKRPSLVAVNNQSLAHVNVDDSDDVNHQTSLSPGWNHSATPLPSSDEEHPGKRRRGGKSGFPNRGIKRPKTHADDGQCRKSITAYHATEDQQDNASARCSPPGSDMATSSCPPVSSITATAQQMKQIRITSPGIASPLVLPQPNTAAVPPRSPKLFPCLLDGCTQVCASAGDLQRHQQSLRHRAPSHSCLACGKSYTRCDALKRHLNSKASCKKEHATKLANTVEVEEVRAEADDEAVQAVAWSSS